ncbi:hypothetical protein ACTI_42940 [Actinoplanes sp. OR16]|uniref:hypothetical protein n=1 Tax=Actinoplanes sp. OR16 TaxID=946334 RepID=UPI000F6CEB5F|nr:hypothetical protein [Actinoplanes sp. OR16]BBH67609.1 hypothetical protein ACTI_42940 [Actinoplanes sp. OR16]
MSLPPVSADVTADAVTALPARLRSRLDAVIDQARGWPVTVEGTAVTVRPDDQLTVTLTDPVTTAGDAVCSCLLAPKCLHRTAVLSLAPILTTATAADAPEPSKIREGRASGQGEERGPAWGVGEERGPARGVGEERGPARGVGEERAPARGRGEGMVSAAGREGRRKRDSLPVNAAQRDAAAALWRVAADLITAGVPGAGAVAQADLLRAVHRARAAGVHAPAASAVRVVEQLRAARSDSPGFRLRELTADVGELLLACHRLAAGDGAALGVARRDYEPVGDLRLHGVFCEPVRAATGHAGVVTYLADAGGTIWVVSDVKPDDARPSTRTSVDLGEVRLSHHDLARGGLRAVNAHASAARRLSHGRARQAVATAGTPWSADPLDGLWRIGVADQVERWLTGVASPVHERPAAYDLAFLEGTVLGADRQGLLLASAEEGGPVVTVVPAVASTAAPYLVNLRLLAEHAAGTKVRLAGRFAGARRVAGLAFAASWLPESHGGHVDLGATTLTRADLPTTGLRAEDRAAGEPGGPPLHLLRHHLERVVAAGRSCLLAGVEGDARRLDAAHLSGAAAVLRGLGEAGVRRTRDVFGRLDPHDAHVLARAWLAAAVYEQAAGREITRAAWR